MASLDDLMKKLQEQDPEAFEESMKIQEQARVEVERSLAADRSLVVKILRLTEKKEFVAYLDSLSFYQLQSHLRALSTNERVFTDHYVELLGHKTLDSINDNRQLNSRLLNHPYPEDVSALGELFLSVENTRDLYDQVSKLDERQTLDHIKPIRTLRNIFQKAYHEYLDQNLFSISKDKFNDVLKRTTWPEVKAQLLKHYPKEEDMITGDSGYKHVYHELLTKPAYKNEDNTVIHIEVDDGGADITGIKPNDLQQYALDFSKWEDWLGFYVSQNNINEFGDATVVAFCLWEMTFVGFDQKDIQDQLYELNERVEESKKHLSEDMETDEDQ